MISGSLHDASWFVTDRSVGASQGAFSFDNLAVHVGDDPRAVEANRAGLATALGVQQVVFARAAHGAGVAYVDGPTHDVPDTDALITDTPGVAIAAQGADCAMVAVATADGWIAAVHCGWKGLVVQVVPATLDALAAAGADLRGARAHVGPTICGSCYRVDAERAREVAAVVPQAVVGGPGIDVRAGVLTQLSERGIASSWDQRCTAQAAELYSHRRDGVTGRHALAIVRRAA